MSRKYLRRTLPLAALLASSAALAAGDYKFFLEGGITDGGDRLATAVYTDGSESNIKAGERFMVSSGVYWRKPAAPLSARLTVGYHSDWAQGDNGNLHFDRFPLELVGSYHINEKWSLGLGLRSAVHARLTGVYEDVDIDGDGLVDGDVTVRYALKSDPGLVVEAAWHPLPEVVFALRGVRETYSYNGLDFSGNHVGLTMQLIF